MTSVNGKWQYPKQKPTPGKKCVDCVIEGIATNRPAPHVGPRCRTHHNAKRRNARIARKVRHVEITYQMSPAEYDALLAYQGGVCALCRTAKGISKRLAVDHDHHQAMLDGHAPDKGCKKCVRGLVCSTCNDILAHARDEAAFGLRLHAYLTSWPTRRRAAGGQWPPTPRGV